jgi:hypothetical protein
VVAFGGFYDILGGQSPAQPVSNPSGTVRLHGLRVWIGTNKGEAVWKTGDPKPVFRTLQTK